MSDNNFKGWKIHEIENYWRVPESLKIDDYNWYKGDKEFPSKALEWIESGFADTYDFILDIQLMLWLELNNFNPANPKLKLDYVFKFYFVEYYFDDEAFGVIEIMFLDYFLGITNEPIGFEDAHAIWRREQETGRI